ncbi:MAG TPA: cytochrome c biogenesis protein CcdC [Pseudogracilibacillus sp.]|nr:cytochrome c biogenesis protein CcdC [Pseudogracilibacillus sp.]
MNQTFLIVASTIVAFGMAILMMFVRMKAAKRPLTVKRILLPPLFMSSGMWMFIIPAFRLTLLEIIEVMIVGVFFSIFLIKTTKFKVEDNEVYLIPSRAFIFILLSLLVVRIIIKLIIGSVISFGETSGMFYLLALSMIFTWRLAMLREFLILQKSTLVQQSNHSN